MNVRESHHLLFFTPCIETSGGSLFFSVVASCSTLESAYPVCFGAREATLVQEDTVSWVTLMRKL